MRIHAHTQTALWLLVSAALLTSLIPGGPIENRDFSHIHPGILGLFNVFLTTLDLGSIPLAYFAAKGRSWALKGAFAAAVAYFGVYAVDLAQLFPRSPTPMSWALALIEVLGMTVAVPLMFAARRSAARTSVTAEVSGGRAPMAVIALVLAVLGLAVVWFATDAAMGGGTAQAAVIRQVVP